MPGFGTLAPGDDWRDQEALAGLALQQEDARKAAAKPQGVMDLLAGPGRIINTLSQTPTAPVDEATQLYFPETYENPLVKGLLGGAGAAVASGATAPGDALAGNIPIYDEEGHISPEMVRRGFDMATLAGGASAAGNLGREAATAGTDLRVLGKQVLASDSGKPAAAIAATDHAPTFYSPTSEALSRIPAKNLTGEMMANQLKRYGAKPEEMDWAGLTDLLASRKGQPITKEEVAQHLEQNSPKITPINRGAPPDWEKLPAAAQYKVEEAWRDSRHPGNFDDAREYYNDVVKPEAPDFEQILGPGARYNEYQLPGGENYRERLLTLPEKKPPPAAVDPTWRTERVEHGNGYRAIGNYDGDPNALLAYGTTPEEALRNAASETSGAWKENYRSGHWDEPNVLVHRRTTDRTFAEPLNEEQQAAVDARRAAQGQLNGNQQQQNIVARQIGETAKPLEIARREGLLADLKAGKISGPEYQRRYETYEVHPDLIPLQDKLQELRTQEDAIRKGLPPEPQPATSRSVHDEENQSDWHQAGQKEGYKTKIDPQIAVRRDALQAELDDWIAREQRSGGGDKYQANRRLLDNPDFLAKATEYTRLSGAANEASHGVPDAPFKDSWHRLALYDQIREAAEKGADEISWTAGKSQPTNPKNLGQTSAAAEKAEAGLIKFYDEQRVNAANKIGKQHGVQVVSHNIEKGPITLKEVRERREQAGISNDQWHSMPESEQQALVDKWQNEGHKIFRMKVPQSLKDQALKRGFSLFEDAGPASAVAAIASHTRGAENVGPAAARDVGGGAGAPGLEKAQATAARVAGAIKPLPGLPQKPLTVGGEAYIPGPIGSVHDVARKYMESTGRPYERLDRYQPVDVNHAKAIAQAYEDMSHAPSDPKVRASYDAMIRETLAQYQALKDSGLKIEAIEPHMKDPYAETPRLAQKDVAENNHLWFFPTESGFGTEAAGEAHPLLQKTGEKLGGRELLANDLFRIVHDYFGHLKEGNGFRAAGEDNAWRTHAKMYSDEARPAMTTETRGQNSWLNYGPHGDFNRTASAADTHYAQQKVGLLPDWAMGDEYPGKPDWVSALKNATYPGAKFAERYPETSPPTLETNEKGRQYFAKTTSPEAQELAKMRLAAKPDIESGNYTPYFDPAKRADVDPVPYGEFHNTKTNLMKKPATREQYDAMAAHPDAVKRIEVAYANGLKQKNSAGNWYFMKQLEDEFINEYGPQEGRAKFKERFADAMAATTGGADPTSNLLMAHYGNYLKAHGLPVPEAHQLPYPIGGQYAGANMEQFRKMIMEGGGIDPLKNEKRYNFSGNFLGRRGPSTIDEQMSNLFVLGMQKPPAGSYGHFEKVIEGLAAKHGVDPRYFQEVAWSGHKDFTEIARGKKGYQAKPMISHVNDAIERTHRVTGMPRNEIVRRGLVRSEIPLYSDTRFGSLVPASAQQDR